MLNEQRTFSALLFALAVALAVAVPLAPAVAHKSVLCLPCCTHAQPGGCLPCPVNTRLPFVLTVADRSFCLGKLGCPARRELLGWAPNFSHFHALISLPSLTFFSPFLLSFLSLLSLPSLTSFAHIASSSSWWSSPQNTVYHLAAACVLVTNSPPRRCLGQWDHRVFEP